MADVGQGSIPQFCRLDSLHGNHAQPVVLKRFSVKVTTPFGDFKVSGHMGGHGIAFVVLNGYTSHSSMYLAAMGQLARHFKVIVANVAGHGGTDPLPRGHSRTEYQAELVAHTLDALGVKKCVLAGHSLGGLVAALVTSSYPDRVIELILLNSITGETWDHRIDEIRPLVNQLTDGNILQRMRALVLLPPLVAPLIGHLVKDSLGMAANATHSGQSPSLLWVSAGAYGTTLLHPTRLIPAGLSILSANPSAPILDKIATAQVPVVVIYGEGDPVVTLADAISTRKRSGGRLILVERAKHADSGHSWLLEDPATLHGILEDGLRGPLGIILRDEVRAAGLNPHIATQRMLESRFYEANAPALAFTPPLRFAKRAGGSGRMVPWQHHAA